MATFGKQVSVIELKQFMKGSCEHIMHVSAVCFVMPWLMRTINQKENINIANMYEHRKKEVRGIVLQAESERE